MSLPTGENLASSCLCHSQDVFLIVFSFYISAKPQLGCQRNGCQGNVSDLVIALIEEAVAIGGAFLIVAQF